MSAEDMIKRQLIAERKQFLVKAVLDGKAVLQALLSAAMTAKGKAVEDINVDALQSHLDQLRTQKEICVRLIQEIKEFE